MVSQRQSYSCVRYLCYASISLCYHEYNTTASITAFRENKEGKKSALPQQTRSVITALAPGGIAVLPLTLHASVLGISGGGPTHPGPVTCFSPSTWTAAWQCALNSAAAEEPCLALPQISALPQLPVTGSSQARGVKKWMCPQRDIPPQDCCCTSWLNRKTTNTNTVRYL